MVEQTYLVFHPTRLAYLQWYLLSFILIGGGILLILSAYGLTPFSVTLPPDYTIYLVILPFLGLLVIVFVSIIRRDDTYVLTNYRVVEKKGIFNIKEDSVNWEKVSNYTMSQNFIERIFNVGTLKLYSMGGNEENRAEVTIKKAPNIHKIKALLDKLIERKGPVV